MQQKWYFLPVLVLLASAPAPAASTHPNIVIILADDMGYGDCGAYNSESKIPTPHIDQLAREGLLFTDAHAAASTCTPSRYGLLTGTNPVRTGVLNTLLATGKPIIDADETTIASLLRTEGYATKMIGKWHLGFAMNVAGKKRTFDFSKPLRGGPLDHGFEFFYGIHGSAGSSPLCYFRDHEVVERPTEQTTWKKIRAGKTLTAKATKAPSYVQEEVSPALCREAVEIIRAHSATPNKPLFLYYASPIPHQPWIPSKAFKGKSGLGPYGDFVMQFDGVVGQINNALKETGLDRNTLLFFTSDNGPGPGAVQAMAAVGHASAGVLRGKKSDSWEGGHRVPFILKWPGRVAAGSRSAAPVNFTDLFATLADFLEVDAVKTYPGSARDSVSFLPVVLDSAKAHKRAAMIHGRHAVRKGDWKLVSTARHEDATSIRPSQFGLYNLADDIAEQNDISQKYPERKERLFSQFETFTKNRTLKSRETK